MITEVAVRLKESARTLPGLRIEWEERFGFQQQVCFRGLVPDYAFLTNQLQGRVASLVEVSSGEDSIARIRQKLLAYSLWSETGEARRFLVELYDQHGASQPRPHFRLLWVMHGRRGRTDDAGVQQLLRAATDVTPAMRRRIWCATAQALAAEKMLDASIWVHLGDLEAVYVEPGTSARRAFCRRLAVALRAAPRHSLFPAEAKP